MIRHYLLLFLYFLVVSAKNTKMYIDEKGVELCHQTKLSSTSSIGHRRQEQIRCLTPDLPLDKCSVYERILRDLEPFKEGISEKAISESFALPAYRLKKIFVRICQGNIEMYRYEGKKISA